MKVSLNWVKQFTDVSVSTDELVKLATERLGGIEGVTDLSKHYEGIVVAKVVSCEKHPNADKLNLCKIDDGNVVKDVARDESGNVQVVCGAPNVREGILVAWIPPGSVVPTSYGEKELFVLEARDLRGELSNGMLASPAELGMSNDHSGILEIDEAVEPGTSFKNLYDLDDTIIEIENKMFTHRPDCFGQLGVAREISGIQHKPFHSPEWYVEGNSLTGEHRENVRGLGVTIQADDLCPRYMAVVLDNVEIKPSPLWLQSYLKRLGVRPINNVVDITNYMMLLTAQPLHAFDFDKVAVDGRADITVRRPKEGEKMTLLDGKEIEPHKDAVLICNANGPIALGGVMGGGNSEVDENTKRIVIECATFDMYNIRKTSMIHGIFTDAVTRFTKGQPAAQLPPVLYKTVQLFEELAGATMAENVIDCKTSELKNEAANYIEVSAQFINQRLGSKLTNEEIVTLLNNVEFEAHEASGPISVTPPFWRTDIEIPEDIVEEIGRLYGFNRLPLSLPQRSIAPVAPDPLRSLKTQIRSSLSRAGANEVLNYSFVHGDLLKKVNQDPAQAFALRNALSPDLQYYRLSLLPSLLDKVHPNIKAGYNQFALFEIGKAHDRREVNEDGLPREFERLAFAFADKNNNPSSGSAYYVSKKFLLELLQGLGLAQKANFIKLSDYNFGEHVSTEESSKLFDKERSAVILYGDRIAGVIGEYKESTQKNLKLPVNASGFEISLSALLETMNSGTHYKPLSKYPSTTQDMTFKVAVDCDYATLEGEVRGALQNSEYNWVVAPVGIYQKEADTKNVTFRITLSHYDRTLAAHEINELTEKIADHVHKAVNAEQV